MKLNMNTESYFLEKKPASPRGGSLSQSCQWPHTLLPSLRCRELQSCLILPPCLPPWFPPPPQISSPPFPCLTIPTGLVFNGRPVAGLLSTVQKCLGCGDKTSSVNIYWPHVSQPRLFGRINNLDRDLQWWCRKLLASKGMRATMPKQISKQTW